jgi:hypothetical protein
MWKYTVSFILGSIWVLSSAWANGQDSFHQGIEAYRAKKWDEARTAFSQTIADNPNSATANYNLGITEMELGKRGSALAHLRMALFLDSELREAKRAIDELSEKIERPFQARELSTIEAIRNSILIDRSVDFFVVMAALLLGISGFLALRYIKDRRVAEEQGLPPTVPTPLFVIATVTLIAIGLNVVKIRDRGMTRVTVVDAKASLQVGPGEEAVTLLEVPEGNELVVQQVRKDGESIWVQATLPGSVTGWVSAQHIRLSSGPQLW